MIILRSGPHLAIWKSHHLSLNHSHALFSPFYSRSLVFLLVHLSTNNLALMKIKNLKR